MDPLGIGGPTRGQAAGPHWRRTSHGLYVPTEVDGSVPEQRIVEQATRLPAEGAVTGWAACRLHGASFFDGLLPDRWTRMPVPLVVGPQRRIRRDDSVTVSYERLGVVDRVTRYGIACATVRRALFDAMRRADSVREAVVSMDMMAAAELTTIRRMREYCATRPGWIGVRQVRAALDLASEDSRSPNETRMRLVWALDAGLPAPAVNQPVYDLDGRLLGVADLLDVAAGVVGEYDGEDHRHAQRHAHDVAREDRLRRHGIEVFRVTGPDLRQRNVLVDRMRAARSRAKWLPPGHRRWTTDDPRADRPAPSLDDVLDHREWLAVVSDSYT